MHRWEFIGLFGGAVAGWPLAARAQQRKNVARIGLLATAPLEAPDALVFLYAFRQALHDLATRHRLPSMANAREFAQLCGLISYGASIIDLLRRAATYVDKIINGATPGDLPVQQPTKFELVVNLKTAKALGLELPPSIILSADEVIE